MPVLSRTVLAALIVPLTCLFCISAWGQSSSSHGASDIGSPFKHFDSACEHCVQLNHKAVAREIRHGIKFLNDETKYAGIKGRQALQGSATELAKVASSIEGGKTFTADQLKDRFARAHHALAVHHHQVAENARSENRLGEASKALKAAAVNLKHGVSWTGENLIVKPGAKIVDSSIKVTGGLIDGTLGGTGKGVKAIGNGIGLLGDKIKRVGKVIKDTTRR